MSEASIQRSSVAWLRSQGCLCIKQSIVGAMGTKGWPDYLVVLKDRKVFWIEFKVPGAKLTELQAQRVTELEDRWHRVYVCRSLGDVKAAYEEETT